MRDRKETLRYVNRVRSAYGLDAVTELPAGTMRSAEDCVIARALNETGFSTLVYQDVIQVDDWEFANIIAREFGYIGESAVGTSDEYELKAFYVPLPTAMSEFVEKFDAGEYSDLALASVD